ncbi:hypothetical protein ACFQE1_15330 [Halobium palmae]|uniref:Uncharacterized protein n=1 Tax=Halobium palmae TaxID=1776492 RepID=A0ABD5S283_9EURY
MGGTSEGAGVSGKTGDASTAGSVATEERGEPIDPRRRGLP